MALVGYPITGSSEEQETYEHTQVKSLFYTNSRWFGIIDDGSGLDQFLWEWDGGFPTNPGDASSNWTKISGVNPSTIASSATYVRWVEGDQDLHCLKIDGVEYYQRYSYTSGTNTWSQTVTNENVGVSIGSKDGAFAVDGSGRAWVSHINASGNLLVRGRDAATGGSWNSDVTLSSATDVVMHDMCTIVDGSGNPGVAVYWRETAGGNKVSYRLDSASVTASWTTISSVPNVGSDDHPSCASHVIDGNTGSILIIANKDGSNNLSCATYDFDASSWSGVEQFKAGGTRAKPVIDGTNDKIYFFWNDTTGGTAQAIVYDSSLISDIVDNTGSKFSGTATTVLEKDTVTVTAFRYCTVPEHVCTSTTKMVIFGQDATGDDVWFDEVDITAPAGLGIPIAAYHHNHNIGSNL